MNSADDHDRTKPARNGGLDALRAVMTLLVLFHHTAITYGGAGSWYYREIKPDGSITATLLLFFNAINQAYFMGVFFLLSGYFTPGSLQSKGAARYIADRLLRLGLPLLIYGFAIGPATIALAQTSQVTGQGKPFMETLRGLWQRGVFEPGPLWFCEALLIFAAIAAAIFLLKPPGHTANEQSRPFPSNQTLAIAALATGALAFIIRLWWPTGANIAGLQFGYFASYIVLFVFGCLAAPSRWLERIPEPTVGLWRRVMWFALPVLPVFALLGESMPAFGGKPEGGWSAPALAYAFWEPLVAWGLILTLLIVFQQRFATPERFQAKWIPVRVKETRQNENPEPGFDGIKAERALSRNWRALSERAYAIYIIHPPMLVAIALLLRDVQAPALIKFVATGTLGCLACFAIAGMLLKIPGAKRVI